MVGIGHKSCKEATDLQRSRATEHRRRHTISHLSSLGDDGEGTSLGNLDFQKHTLCTHTHINTHTHIHTCIHIHKGIKKKKKPYTGPGKIRKDLRIA